MSGGTPSSAQSWWMWTSPCTRISRSIESRSPSTCNSGRRCSTSSITPILGRPSTTSLSSSRFQQSRPRVCSTAPRPRRAKSSSGWSLVGNGAVAVEAGGALMPAKKLSDAEVQAQLGKRKGWTLVNGKLHPEFQCKDFVAGVGHMTRVGFVALSSEQQPQRFHVRNKQQNGCKKHSQQCR